jgi:peptide-methionine (R)-S-oxide reductase
VQNQKPTPMNTAVKKTEIEWKAQLSEMEFEVLRNKGTGKYVCAACSNDLFTSDTKFDSHCGWPSFDEAIKGAVIYKKDISYGMERIEVMCAKCEGHLGHVFDDGPKETTGQRYCTNSVSIKFVPTTK